MNFVQQLLRTCSNGHEAARARDLGDDASPVLPHFGNWKTESGKIGNLFEARVCVITAGDLPGTLEKVTDGRPGAEARPVLERPLEPMDERREKQRGVRDASRDDDLGAGREGVHDRRRTEVGVGGHERVAECADGLTCVLKNVRPASDLVDHVIAGDSRDLQPAQAEAPGDLPNQVRSGERIGRAHVRDNRDVLRVTRGKYAAHPFGQQRIEAGGRRSRSCLLRQRDRPFGQTFEDQIVEAAALGELHGRLDSIAGVAGAATDPDRFHSVSTPNRTANAELSHPFINRAYRAYSAYKSYKSYLKLEV